MDDEQIDAYIDQCSIEFIHYINKADKYGQSAHIDLTESDQESEILSQKSITDTVTQNKI